jgi:hypothetical protein
LRWSETVLLVKDVDWEKLKQEILREESFIDKYGDECKETTLGKLADLTPSGEHRDFGRPARNLAALGSYKGYVRAPELGSRPPRKNEQQDSDWWTDLCNEGNKHGFYIRPSDEDRKILVVGMKVKDRSETSHPS